MRRHVKLDELRAVRARIEPRYQPKVRWNKHPVWPTTERSIAGLTLATLAVVLVLVGIGRYGSVRGLVNIGEAPGVATDATSWLLLQASAAHRLLGMLIIPVGQTIDADYDVLPQPVSGIIGLVTLTVIGVTAWRVRRRYPLASYGLAWVLGVILPRLVVQTPRSYLAEHHMYLAIPGAMLVVVDRGPAVVVWIHEVLLALLTALSLVRASRQRTPKEETHDVT